MIVEVVPEPQAAADGLFSGQVGGGLIDELFIAPLAEQLELLLPEGERLPVVPAQVDEGVIDNPVVKNVRIAPHLRPEIGPLQTQLGDELQAAPLVIPEAVAGA
ncbi:hypothetical protein D3C85_1439420 [compost metagenome]